MQEGDVLYRVGWRKGIPFIEVGHVLVSSGKKGTLKVKVDGYEKLQSAGSFFSTMKEAIKEDLLASANEHSKWFNKNPNPWQLVHQVVEVWRLYRKLKKHHLIRGS